MIDKQEYLRILRRLLARQDLDLNRQNDRNQAAVHLAASNKDLRKLYLLLREGKARNLDVNLQDGVGNTPLHIAIMRGELDKVQCLLKYFTTSRDIRNNEGRPPGTWHSNWDRMKYLVHCARTLNVLVVYYTTHALW